MGALLRIHNAGFKVALVADGFEVTQASLLTQQQREFLKTHKTEIIAELSTYQKIINWLASIGEDDQLIIDETIERCKADSETLSYFLQRAEGIAKPH